MTWFRVLGAGLTCGALLACSEKFDEQQAMDATFCLPIVLHAREAADRRLIPYSKKEILRAADQLVSYFAQIDKPLSKLSKAEQDRLSVIAHGRLEQGEQLGVAANESGWTGRPTQILSRCLEVADDL